MYKAIRGTKDILPEEVGKWQFVERKAAEIFSLYGFQEIRTPIFEETGLFERSIGNTTDIVNKEMYTFRMGDDSLTLRPENTAPVVRAYIQHALHRRGTRERYYYIGPMFRYERPQKGRQRQFHQIGAEILGEKSPLVDAELIQMSIHFLEAAGIKNFETAINSVGCPSCRQDYREMLRSYLKPILGKLCEDCNRRYSGNPLRVFDCKVERCRAELESAPVLIDSLCKECSTDFQKVREYLSMLEIDYILEPKLVRGLDYYVKTAFEIFSRDLGSQSSILGGGRYDGLVKDLGGPSIPGIGFAAGMERIVMLLPEEAGCEVAGTHIYVAAMNEDGFRRAIQICRDLRRKGLKMTMPTEMKSINSQMRAANKENASFVLFLGSDELKSGKATIKDMRTGEQRSIPFEEIDSFFDGIMSDPRR